jgi:hypothetical protein
LNDSLNLVIEVRLLKLLDAIRVAVWELLLVDWGYREMIDCDVLLFGEKKLIVPQ